MSVTARYLYKELQKLTSASEHNVRVICYIEWCNERINASNTRVGAARHAPEGGGIASEGEGGDGGECLHVVDIAPGAGGRLCWVSACAVVMFCVAGAEMRSKLKWWLKSMHKQFFAHCTKTLEYSCSWSGR